ncbi:ABC transporter ATP-binding protein [Curvibacter sp. CHRR-16]|uniref:ABC transporter ATP-binding protein n=1 Tax=Curvibacter sp. CHRR-16 TaxID=2835872 RepID=UPI001BDADC31|nr:ABC transporter ATP-binding protein [Curvibacter sp. CHRR-16]MBT0570227.1 ABC transporter ATP-binding protein [Curvibacter sp. CHRR-16]
MSLVLQGLGVAYGGHTVLQDVHAQTQQQGAMVALVGANGAGKSSLLRALAGLQTMQGAVLLDGEDLSRWNPAQRARHIAYMPQTLPQTTSLSVFESVLGAVRTACPQWGAQQALERVQAVLLDLQLEALAMRPLATLSGGQRQMAGLAQLLARAPRLLLLDEPTSALDLRWQLCLMQALQAHVQRYQTLCLMAVHDLNLAARFGAQWWVLAQGRLLAQGSPAEVLSPDLLRQAYGIEARVERCSQDTPVVIVERAL